MYNEERKMQYLQEKQSTSKLSTNTKNIFDLAEQREELYRKDLCEWDSSQIIEFYKYYSTPNFTSLIVINTALREYTTWCMLNGMVEDNQNHYGEIGTEAICQCIDLDKLRRLVFTREQLLEEIRHLPNFIEQFIFIALFEGVPMAGGVICDVKMSDLNGNILTLSNGDKLEVSKDLIHLMELANDEEDYIAFSKTGKEKVFKLVPGDTIIRPIDTKRARMDNTTYIIGAKIRRSAQYLGMEENLTVKNIAESGRLDYIKRIADKYNVSYEDATKETKYRKMHEERYGHLQNAMAYWLTYGQIISG